MSSSTTPPPPPPSPRSPSSSPDSTWPSATSTDSPIDASRDPSPDPAPDPAPARVASDDRDGAPPLSDGEMRFGWRVALFSVWLLGAGILSSVWQLTVQVGHHTWWLGPAGDPNPTLVRLLPFVGPVVTLIGIMTNARWTLRASILSSLIMIGLGLIDLNLYQRFGLIEIIGGALCLVATAAAQRGRVFQRSPADSTT